ncbi:hypothetical protein B0T16DRAFT_444952 [Cercophora newfieldiana]|uniref:Uncharacterized protein n=1 Tax=Cercophora newfieldiana TaxID=92897 RepID=A0AA39YAI4_9PEZI|nr:hypothetical protein B0T16DRAFT_444952 [Cercophora newfieldiana]
MKFEAVVLFLGVVRGVVLPRDDTSSKVATIEAKNFKDLGAKRVQITYGPYLIPSSTDEATHGMVTSREMNALMPCRECFITGFTTDLRFEDGKTTANANKQMWLHHSGLMNLNRTDAACTHWPERMGVNGNERSSIDFTLKGTRKAGYYLRANDQVFLTIDAMNMAPAARNVTLVMEWEYLPGIPADFDIVFPIWLDVKGNCLNESSGAKAEDLVFTAKSATGWTAQHSGDLILAVPHIHDGNVNQQVFQDGKKVCESIPGYGETADFVSHNEGGDGHGHDHGTSEHTYHVSSITQCENVAKVAPGSKFTITSEYDMKTHTPMKDHDGSLEPIMGIQFLHLARPQAEGIKDILAMKNGDLDAFVAQVRGGGG